MDAYELHEMKKPDEPAFGHIRSPIGKNSRISFEIHWIQGLEHGSAGAEKRKFIRRIRSSFSKFNSSTNRRAV